MPTPEEIAAAIAAHEALITVEKGDPGDPAETATTVAASTTFGQRPDPGTSGQHSDGAHQHGTPEDPLPPHLKELDPHRQYELRGQGQEAGQRAAQGELLRHEGDADPHKQYGRREAVEEHVRDEHGVPISMVPAPLAIPRADNAGKLNDWVDVKKGDPGDDGAFPEGLPIYEDGQKLGAFREMEFSGEGVAVRPTSNGRARVHIPGPGRIVLPRSGPGGGPGGAGGAHPDLATHDTMGLATDAELAAHAAGPHGGAHPDLATHDALGLATDAELTTHAGAADPHAVYQKESEKGAAGGYASLDGGGTVPDAQIPAAIARDSEVTTAVSNHEGAANPHPAYATDTDLTNHVGAADPHAVYALDTDLTTHAAAADPHTGYQKESEKGAASGYAGLGANSLVPQAQLGTGSAGGGAKFLADDQTYKAAGGAGTDPPEGSYAPGSYTIATDKFRHAVKRQQFTGSQRLTLQGTGRLSISN
jgi:hypothetical protein